MSGNASEIKAKRAGPAVASRGGDLGKRRRFRMEAEILDEAETQGGGRVSGWGRRFRMEAETRDGGGDSGWRQRLGTEAEIQDGGGDSGWGGDSGHIALG